MRVCTRAGRASVSATLARSFDGGLVCPHARAHLTGPASVRSLGDDVQHKDTLARFQALRDAVKTELKWRAPGPLRDMAALAAMPIDASPEHAARAVRDASETIKAQAGDIRLLRRSTRYPVAATLLAGGLDPALACAEINGAKPLWRGARLRYFGLDGAFALIVMARTRL